MLGDGTQSFVQARQALYLLSRTLPPSAPFLDPKFPSLLSSSQCCWRTLQRKKPHGCAKAEQRAAQGSGLTDPHLHLKSHEPAASKTLLGCQSKLRTVERIGFLMCLLTHLRKRKTSLQTKNGNIFQATPIKSLQIKTKLHIYKYSLNSGIHKKC